MTPAFFRAILLQAYRLNKRRLQELARFQYGLKTQTLTADFATAIEHFDFTQDSMMPTSSKDPSDRHSGRECRNSDSKDGGP